MISETNSKQRGTTVLLNYAILLGISGMLIGLLLVSINTFVTSSENQAIQSELEVTTETLASEIEFSDRTAAGTNTQFSYSPPPTSPIRNIESKFRVEHQEDNTYILIAESQQSSETVRVPMKLQNSSFNTTSIGNSTTLTIGYEDNELFFGEQEVDEPNTPEPVDGFTIPDEETVEESIVSTAGVDGGEESVVEGFISAEEEIDLEEEVEVEGSLDSESNISIDEDSTIQGNISAEEEVDIDEDSTIQGNISAEEEVDIDEEVTIGGSVNSESTIDIDEDNQVNGDVTAEDDIDIGEENEILGSVESEENITVDEDTNISGNVNSESTVELDEGNKIGGEIQSRDSVFIEEENQITGSVTSEDSVEIDEDSTFESDITAENTVETDGETFIQGDIEAETAILGEETVVEGDVIADEIICEDDVTINGESCDSYTPPGEEPDSTVKITDFEQGPGNSPDDLEWASENPPENAEVDILVDGEVEESGKDPADSTRLTTDEGEVIEVQLLDENGNVLSTDSLVV